jgi:steroid delta-isomerase
MANVRLNLQSVFFGAVVVFAPIFAASSPDVAFAAAPKATAGKMKASLEALRDALNARDKNKIVGLYADDATIEDPAGSPLKIGKAAIDGFYGSAIDRGITMDIIKVEELPDQRCNMEANIHVGPKVVHTHETYFFKANGKIAAMKSMPKAKD